MTASADAARRQEDADHDKITVSIDHDRVGRRGADVPRGAVDSLRVSIDHDRVGRRGHDSLYSPHRNPNVSIDHDRVGRRGRRPRKACNERHLAMLLRVRA